MWRVFLRGKVALHRPITVPWLQAGIHIVTPNKKLNSGPLPQYQALRQFQRGSYIHFFYEARPGPVAVHRQLAVWCRSLHQSMLRMKRRVRFPQADTCWSGQNGLG